MELGRKEPRGPPFGCPLIRMPVGDPSVTRSSLLSRCHRQRRADRHQGLAHQAPRGVAVRAAGHRARHRLRVGQRRGAGGRRRPRSRAGRRDHHHVLAYDARKASQLTGFNLTGGNSSEWDARSLDPGRSVSGWTATSAPGRSVTTGRLPVPGPSTVSTGTSVRGATSAPRPGTTTATTPLTPARPPTRMSASTAATARPVRTSFRKAS